MLAGFLSQLLGWCFMVLAVYIYLWSRSSELAGLVFLVGAPLPLASVAYGLYRYFAWVGKGQRLVTVAFVGGLLVKTFLLPFIKGILTGALFTWFMRWLRGDKVKPRGA